jgi:hydrogenase nickel incorporation protein HypB
VTLLSVPEGDDKPAKYPVMFRSADLVMISKSDLLPVLDDFNPDKAKQYLHDIASQAPVLELSSKNSSGMQLWFDWLRTELDKQRAYIAANPSGSSHHHHHHHHNEHAHEHEHKHQQPVHSGDKTL